MRVVLGSELWGSSLSPCSFRKCSIAESVLYLRAPVASLITWTFLESALNASELRKVCVREYNAMEYFYLATISMLLALHISFSLFLRVFLKIFSSALLLLFKYFSRNTGLSIPFS